MMFTMIFGSDKFEALVGELKMASMMDIEDRLENVNKYLWFKQHKREILCAVNLAEKLDKF